MNNMTNFKRFEKIPHFKDNKMYITQKIHGSNAQIYIYKDNDGEMGIYAGSRTRWLTKYNDNYGFHEFLRKNFDEIVQILGEGRHYGEWAGPGINNGEGLKEKTLFLFNHQRWNKTQLPNRVKCVPCLYEGPVFAETPGSDIIDNVMNKLKENGSYISPGFMNTEGIVIQIGDNFYKKVFDQEETKWKITEKVKNVSRETLDIDYLLQPIRLQKLLSRDEKYRRDYPKSLKDICQDYVRDLIEENQILGTEDEVTALKKEVGRKVFMFVKNNI